MYNPPYIYSCPRVSSSVGDWCSQDTGYQTVTDGRGYPHNVFISATRDGAIWLRVGLDHKSQDWVYNREVQIEMEVRTNGNVFV